VPWRGNYGLAREGTGKIGVLKSPFKGRGWWAEVKTSPGPKLTNSPTSEDNFSTVYRAAKLNLGEKRTKITVKAAKKKESSEIS